MSKQLPLKGLDSQDGRRELHQCVPSYCMRLFKLIVTFFFIGSVKLAPGTVASFAAVLIFYVFAKYLNVFSFILIISAITLLSFIAISSYTADVFEKDKSEIVVDEVIGQSIALLPLLIFTESISPKFFMCIISLLFFRFFDIVKPYPINIVDKMNNTFGVIFDDILAGIFAAILLTFVLIF